MSEEKMSKKVIECQCGANKFACIAATPLCRIVELEQNGKCGNIEWVEEEKKEMLLICCQCDRVKEPNDKLKHLICQLAV